MDVVGYVLTLANLQHAHALGLADPALLVAPLAQLSAELDRLGLVLDDPRAPGRLSAYGSRNLRDHLSGARPAPRDEGFLLVLQRAPPSGPPDPPDPPPRARSLTYVVSSAPLDALLERRLMQAASDGLRRLH